MQQFHKFITWHSRVVQHASGAPCPSSGAYDCISSLWFYRCSVAVAVFLVVVCQTMTNNAATITLQR